MTNQEKHKQWERGIILLMNIDGWELEWIDDDSLHYNAKGKTPKGFDCIIAFKLLHTYYNNKSIQKWKYDALMQEKCMKFYYVFDCKGNYLYHIDNLLMNEQFTFLDCQSNEVKLINEFIYLFSESQASIVNLYSEQK
jgi:hypothetical protein